MQPTPKRATWLELFYDIAFIALVAQLTYLASSYHDSLIDVFNIGLVGYVIFISWWATTANRNMQPCETDVDKFLVQVQMVGAFFMSLTMADLFAGSYTGFFVTLGGVRVIQAFTLLRMYYLYPSTRPKTYNIVQGFLTGSLIWIATAFAPMPYHAVLAVTALLIDILTPLTRGEGNTKRYLNVFHLQERLGLFLMLVIGESMIVVALANSASAAVAVQPTIIFAGLGMMIALWWLYFEHSDMHQGVRPHNLFVFIHSHALMFGSIILLSVGYKLAIEGKSVSESIVFILLGALGLVVALVLIRVMLHGGWRRTLTQWLSLLLFGVVTVWGLWTTNRYLELVAAVTVLFLLAAYLDRKIFFRGNSVDKSSLPV